MASNVATLHPNPARFTITGDLLVVLAVQVSLISQRLVRLAEQVKRACDEMPPAVALSFHDVIQELNVIEEIVRAVTDETPNPERYYN